MKLQLLHDGREFYDKKTGSLLFQASHIVKDFDIEAAQRARDEFEAWVKSRYPNETEFIFEYVI